MDINTKLKNIYAMREFTAVKDCLVGGGMNFFTGEIGELTLKQLNEQKQPTWNADDMLFGLNRLLKISESGKEYVFYSGGKGARLVYFPAEGENREFVILASGGGYGACCNLAEAFPVAARLNELGYSCFCLTYRTATQETFVSGLMPQPLDDFAEAYRFLAENRERFNIVPENYAACGFSAGGHICAAWGTEKVGYAHYGMPAPQKLILAYPLVDLNILTGVVGDFMLNGLFGRDFEHRLINEYSPIKNASKKYPKTYLVQAENDSTVSVESSKEFTEVLKSNNVSVKAEFVESGEHGFGLGSKTPADGWIDRAIKF